MDAASLVLLSFTALSVLACAVYGYRRSRDPLHPLIFVTPMFLYVYVLRPGVLIANGQLQEWLPIEGQMAFAQALFAAGLLLFCLGVLYASRNRPARLPPLKMPLDEKHSVAFFRLGCLLGSVALSVYLLGILSSGGFLKVYGQAKGGARFGSGWISELVNLAIPAVALLVLSWQGQARRSVNLALAALFSAPLLLTGLLGARRGPTFIIFATALVAWYLATPFRVPLRRVLVSLCLIGGLVLFLISHRRDIYIGSEASFDWQKFMAAVAPVEASSDDDTVFLYGFVNVVHGSDSHHWGLTYVGTYLVRPIPKQLWPTKYEDMGLGWMVRQSDFAGIPDDQWIEILGWAPARGAATGFVGDLFMEFSWFGLAGCFLMGVFYGFLWMRASSRGGLWALLYIVAAALTIYIPTQSVSAVFHRFLFVTLFLVIVWRFLIGRTARGHSSSKSVHPRPAVRRTPPWRPQTARVVPGGPAGHS